MAFLAGQILTADDLNNNFTGAAKLTRASGTQNFSNNTTTVIDFDTTDYAVGATANLTSNHIEITRTGLYSCKAYLRIDLSAGVGQIMIAVNGSTSWGDRRNDVNGTGGYTVSGDLYLTAGDLVTATFYQNEGITKASASPTQGSPALAIARVGGIV